MNNSKIKKNDLLDDNILNQYLDKYPEAKQNYNNNKIMIDFNYIPKKYISQINNLIIKNIIKK